VAVEVKSVNAVRLKLLEVNVVVVEIEEDMKNAHYATGGVQLERSNYNYLKPVTSAIDVVAQYEHFEDKELKTSGIMHFKLTPKQWQRARFGKPLTVQRNKATYKLKTTANAVIKL